MRGIMKRIFTFGEIMLRISPWNRAERVLQTNNFRVEPAGSESNVAVALAMLGEKVSFITKLPDNELKEIIYQYLSQYRVDSSYVSTGGKRLGLLWTEIGIGPRTSYVTYDRDFSAFSDICFEDFEWNKIKDNAAWFHTSAISPAVSKSAHDVLSHVLELMEKEGTKISIDLNYRSKLWKWLNGNKNKKINEIMNNLCSRAFLITGNETDFQNSLGFTTPEEPKDVIEIYKGIAEKCFTKMPKLRYITISLRESFSASENRWSGILFLRKNHKINYYKGREYQLNNIVDRVGAGDSFCAGIIHGILNYPKNPQYIIDFAITLSALKHSVRGDASQFSVEDVKHTLKTKGSGRIIR